MRRSAAFLAVTCLLYGAGCSKDEETKGEDTSKSAGTAGEAASGTAKGEGEKSDTAAPASSEGEVAVDPAALAQKVGVEPGPVEYGADEGAAAVVASAEGKVEFRRVGNETWEETKAEAQLHEGDQIRAADGGMVTVTLVDETSIELTEESALAIGSRKATEDPASSAAVLYGVARFTVAERAPGEGPFLVFTPGGVVATKGTVYTVGVAASGATRVGVESGAVEVAGGAKLDAPVAVAAGHVVMIAPAGELGEVEAMGDADWGAWRDGAEADVEAKAAAEFHAKRAEALEADLEAAYAELETQTAAAAAAEAEVEAAQKANDTAAYEAAAPELGGAVDASFAMSLRLQFLSNAMLSHAYVAEALYLRNPDVVAVIEPARPRLAAAVLWNKKYHAVADLHVEPLRAYYYVHHPRGRAHARLVAYPIPPFYARVNLNYRVPEVRSRVRLSVYRPPLVIVRSNVRVKKHVYVRAPRIGWYASVKTRVRPAPTRVRWYVKPRAPRARVVFGVRPRASVRVKTVFRAAPPRPRAKAVVRFGGGVRGDVRSRADVRDHRTDVRGGAGVKIKAGVRGHAAPPDVRDHRTDVRAGVRVRGGSPPPRPDVRVRGGAAVRGRADLRGGGDGDARGSARAGARVKVKAPKIRPPKIKAKANVKVKGGIRLGD
jgi:hypothetical protein